MNILDSYTIINIGEGYNETYNMYGPVVLYLVNGKRHREDGPAVEYANGDKYWFINDKNHREDGPAMEYANGDKYWFMNGRLHREDGPAIEYANGDKCWFINGRLHREDGPAVEKENGDKRWYINDIHLGSWKCISIILYRYVKYCWKLLEVVGICVYKMSKRVKNNN
jgi:hypothetical protein